MKILAEPISDASFFMPLEALVRHAEHGVLAVMTAAFGRP